MPKLSFIYVMLLKNSREIEEAEKIMNITKQL